MGRRCCSSVWRRTWSRIGDYSPTAGSSLRVILGGLTAGTQFGQLQVGGTVTLNGTLSIVLTNGFAPVAANSFLVLSAGTRSGTFTSVTGDDLGGGLLLVPTYALGELTLVATQQSHLQPLALAGDRMLRWNGAADGYELQTSTSILGPWTPVLAPVTRDNGESIVHLPAEGTRFYRLVPSSTPRPGNNPTQ